MLSQKIDCYVYDLGVWKTAFIVGFISAAGVCAIRKLDKLLRLRMYATVLVAYVGKFFHQVSGYRKTKDSWGF